MNSMESNTEEQENKLKTDRNKCLIWLLHCKQPVSFSRIKNALKFRGLKVHADSVK